MPNDPEADFDVVILGTGLVESIAAAALSKASYKVAHIDTNDYYGGNEASLSQEELLAWGEAVNQGRHPKFSGFSGTSATLPFARQYSICLRPSVIPALGPLISSLIGSGVAKYSGFRLLDSISVYSPDSTVKSVPGSKEDVFNSKDISLIEKRRLMRFLKFSAGDFEDATELQGKEELPFIDFLKSVFSLSEDIGSVIAYSLAHCTAPQESTLSALLRLRRYLKSIGRYGPSPFLIGHYGGIGDISQGFCRAAAVSGGVYVLGRSILSAAFNAETSPDFPISFALDDFPEPIRCRLVLSTADMKGSGLDIPKSYIGSSREDPRPVTQLARGIVIIDKPMNFRTASVPQEDETVQEAPTSRLVDAALLVFPPNSVENGSSTHAATAHITGDACLSTPKGKWTIYFMLPLSAPPSASAEDIIQPYVYALLSLPSHGYESPIVPLSSYFFFEHSSFTSQPRGQSSPTELYRHIVAAPLDYSTFPDLPDSATLIAEAAYREAICTLRSLKGEVVEEATAIDFWPPMEVGDAESDSDD